MKTAFIVVFWLFVWQVATWAIGNRILLAGPTETAVALAYDLLEPAFWASLGFSFARIAGGFTAAFALAIAFATASWKISLFGDFIRPLVTFMKSVPVVCIIVLLLVWMGSANVSIIAVALMVFPPVYFACFEGLRQTSHAMREMLRVFRIPARKRIRYYYIPTVMPYVASTAKVAVGIAWKSGVAAEVIGIPAGSIGAGIYSAKIGLSTADLFGWTFAIVGLSALCEKLFLKALTLLNAHCATIAPRKTGRAGRERTEREEMVCVHSDHPSRIAFQKVAFAYDGKPVLDDFTCYFASGERFCLMGPSGAGKSTTLDLACGLLSPNTGTLERPERVSRAFQEDRLLEQLTAWENVALVCPHLPEAERALLKFDLDEILGQDSAALSIRECSGGMKRKIALVRALASPGDALLLDEPFAGLDDESRTDAVALLNRHLHGRTLVVATHDYDDLAFLDADLVRLNAV